MLSSLRCGKSHYRGHSWQEVVNLRSRCNVRGVSKFVFKSDLLLLEDKRNQTRSKEGRPTSILPTTLPQLTSMNSVFVFSGFPEIGPSGQACMQRPKAENGTRFWTQFLYMLWIIQELIINFGGRLFLYIMRPSHQFISITVYWSTDKETLLRTLVDSCKISHVSTAVAV